MPFSKAAYAGRVRLFSAMGWIILVDYPPLGSRMKVEFDARKAAKIDTAA